MPAAIEARLRRAWALLRRVVGRFGEDDLGDRAAALTYYAMLSLFPSLLLLVSVLGLVGSAATQPLLDNIEQLAPGPAQEILRGAVEAVEARRGAAGFTLVVALLAAMWAGSGYMGAFMRASDAIRRVERGRAIWVSIPARIGLTLGLVTLVAAAALAVVISGDVAERVGEVVGAEGTAVRAWGLVKWPALVLLVSVVFSLLYWAAPSVGEVRRFRPLSPGALLAVGLWIAGSGAFALYVSSFAAYGRTYGALASVAVFLIWLWVTNIALLVGATLNAELDEER